MNSADNIDVWLKRFRTADAQEEESLDESAGYRALLHQAPEPKARPQPETKARTPKPPVPADHAAPHLPHAGGVASES